MKKLLCLLSFSLTSCGTVCDLVYMTTGRDLGDGTYTSAPAVGGHVHSTASVFGPGGVTFISADSSGSGVSVAP